MGDEKKPEKNLKDLREYTYKPIPKMTRADIEIAIRDNNLEILHIVPLSAALHSEDPVWAQEICLTLSHHSDFNVRGNAILGFGHIARIHGVLDRDRVQPIIEDGLHDAAEYVRSHAHDAAGDVEHFLKWRIRRLRSVK